jgi:hypothetical protein
MDHLPTILAYLGPETMLPMTSVVAGVAGFLMMFGRNAWRLASGAVRRLNSRRSARPKLAGPHRRIDSAGLARKRARV